MFRKSRTTVFIRYALSYLAVVLLLFFSITGYLYASMSSRAREEYIGNQINRLSRIAAQHENYISAMLNTAEEIGLSPHIEFFRYDEEPWKAYDLQLQLVPYTAANSTFCGQVYLHFFGDNRVYSSSSSMPLELFARMMRYEFIPMERLTALIDSVDRLTILPSQQVSSALVDTSRIVTFLVPLGSSPGSRKGALLFLIKDSVYQSLFADVIEGHVNTYIHQDGTLLSCAEEIPVDPELLAASPEEDSGTFRWKGEEWTQVSLPARNWGLSYSAAVRNADITSAITGQILSNLAILPVFVALSLLLALWMARRHAKPIREISGLLAGGEPEHRDELQRITTGIHQLTTRNLELSSRLEQTLPVQRHDFVFRFVKGRFRNRQEAAAAGNAVGLEIDRPRYAVILCGGAGGNEHPFDLKQPPFDRIGGFSGAGVELVALRANLYLVFADHEGTLFQVAEQLRLAGTADDDRCVTAVSCAHEDFREAPEAYLEAAAAYENRFVMGNRKVLQYSDISSNLAEILPQARRITTSISQALTLGNRDVLDKRIDELLHFLKNTNMSPFAFRMIYNEVISSLVHTHSDALSGSESVMDFYNIFTLTSCQSIDDLDDLLRRLCDYLLSGNGGEERADAAGEGDEIGQVVRYMEEHFTDPEISITALADSVDLSTTRFSLSFKEKVGMSPLDFLTLLRVEKAKELLASTGLTIQDISVQVGYYDSGSFIRRFKHITGETPLQYRRGRSRDTAKEDAHEDE